MIKHIWELFLLQGKIFFLYIYHTLLLHVKCFDKTTALCLLKAWFIDIYSGTCCVRNKLLSYFSSSLQILETYRRIRETETTRERDAANTLQSFPAAGAKVPPGPCPYLSTISSFLLLQTCPWALSQTQQNNTGMKIMQKATFTIKNPNFSSPFFGLSALCRPVFW